MKEPNAKPRSEPSWIDQFDLARSIPTAAALLVASLSAIAMSFVIVTQKGESSSGAEEAGSLASEENVIALTPEDYSLSDDDLGLLKETFLGMGFCIYDHGTIILTQPAESLTPEVLHHLLLIHSSVHTEQPKIEEVGAGNYIVRYSERLVSYITRSQLADLVKDRFRTRELRLKYDDDLHNHAVQGELSELLFLLSMSHMHEDLEEANIEHRWPLAKQDVVEASMDD